MSRQASRAHRLMGMQKMAGKGLESPQVAMVEAGHQEALKASHIKVNSNYFGIDPNCNFDASSILVEDRSYNSDTTPSATQPITWTIQPQFNVFRSLSESRFVFQVSLGNLPANQVGKTYSYYPKPYFSSLLVQDCTWNINNVNVADQHSSTAQYAHFIKTVMLEANLKPSASAFISISNVVASTQGGLPVPSALIGCAGEDVRSLTEGVMNTDWLRGINTVNSVQGNFLSNIDGTTENQLLRTGKLIEITYRPKDGVWLQPKLLPPGVVLNWIVRLNSVENIFNGYTFYNKEGTQQSSGTFSSDWSLEGTGVSLNIVSAKYLERQYTPTQNSLKSYQAMISQQPVYIPAITGNTLLFPVPAGQTSVQLTNLFAGRLPNLVIVGLLNQNPTIGALSNASIQDAPPGVISFPTHQFKTYSPLTPTDVDSALYSSCLSSVNLTVNGRLYPHLFKINCQALSNQDTHQLYEMYKQCALVSSLNGRVDVENNQVIDTKYKMDNPLLTYGEFRANFTFFCYNIRRNGTLPQDSGDKEVGGVDILAQINSASNQSVSGQTRLLCAGINSDSILSITDGGSTASFVF